MKACSRCGKALSFWRGLGSSTCPDCQAEADRQQAAAAHAEEEAAARRECEAAERRYAAATRGEATAEDLRQLEWQGYLVVGGRLIRCPVCGHDRFAQRRTLLSSRAAALFNTQWASDSAATRICQQCGHILWFLRQPAEKRKRHQESRTRGSSGNLPPGRRSQVALCLGLASSSRGRSLRVAMTLMATTRKQVERPALFPAKTWMRWATSRARC
jgi:DNA-directed RNA polymerase subunit RPC12/RpoP